MLFKKRVSNFLLLIFALLCIGAGDVPKYGQLEVVAQLPISPGNIAVTENGRIFITIHPFRRGEVQLAEVTGTSTYEAWPDKKWNGEFGRDDGFNNLLGITIDRKNRLWVIDTGVGETQQIPKVLAFDINSKELVFRFDLLENVAPEGSFVQDLVVDDKNEFVYLADAAMAGEPGIIIIDIEKRIARRFSGHESFLSEDVDLRVEGKILRVPKDDGKLVNARIGLNPITLSADNEQLFYGAMTGETWYRIPTKYFREGAADEVINRFVYTAGPKPVSDGASSDTEDNHFFTNINNNSIDRVDILWETETLVKDERLIWPDALSFGEESWLYIAVNQLNRSPRFNNGQEKAELPYYIMRVWTGTEGIAGR